MTDTLDRRQAAMADRYTVERELGRAAIAAVSDSLTHPQILPCRGSRALAV